MIWSRPQLRVLFVCTANVCRSPLAEAMLRQRLRALGLGRRIQVRSAGTRVGQPGRPPDPRVVRLAQEKGFALGRIRARQVNSSIVMRCDLILVMEPEHRNELTAMMQAADPPGSVLLLGSFLPPEMGSETAIPDPYFGDWHGFLEVFDLVDSALEGLADHLQQMLSPG